MHIFFAGGLKMMTVMGVCVLLSGCMNRTPLAPSGSNELTPNDLTVSEPTTEIVKADSVDVIKVPGGVNPFDKRYDDVTEALQIALEKTKDTYGDYEFIISQQPMTGTRFVEEVKSGEHVNVIWRTYSPELSKELIPIYIDPRKGLLGYRLFLIRSEEQAKFSKITTLNDLKAFSVGQGQDWMDIQVFEYNQIPVVTGSEYEGLFKMLTNKRFDYFSRGVGEIFTEFADRKDALPDMKIESDLVIYYPWPYFYYVNPNEKRIAERIEKGLTIMINDGSMEKLFNKYYKEIIERANIKNRRIIRLENPLIESVPIDLTDKIRWYNPEN